TGVQTCALPISFLSQIENERLFPHRLRRRGTRAFSSFPRDRNNSFLDRPLQILLPAGPPCRYNEATSEYGESGLPCHRRGSEKGSPVQIRRGPATVSGERSRRMPLSVRMGRRGGAKIHEPGDLPFSPDTCGSPFEVKGEHAGCGVFWSRLFVDVSPYLDGGVGFFLIFFREGTEG